MHLASFPGYFILLDTSTASMYKTSFSRYTNFINIREMNDMFDIFKPFQDTSAMKTAFLLRSEIERTKHSIDSARHHFEQAVDPTLIDCYIYELNAAQLRYQFLLRKFKSQEK